jgi:hypothetical protein
MCQGAGSRLTVRAEPSCHAAIAAASRSITVKVMIGAVTLCMTPPIQAPIDAATIPALLNVVST